jgi:pyruvate,water dikinase
MQGYNPRSGEFNDSLRGDYLWTNSNFGEALPEVMTPLTWSLIQIFAAETIPPFLPSYHPVIGNIGGRFYMNISLFASMMKAMGFSRERMNYESEEFFGTLPEDFAVPAIPMSRFRLLRSYLPQAIKLVRRRRAHLQRLVAFTAAVPAVCAGFRKKIDTAQSPAALAALWSSELDPFMRELSIMLQAGTSKYENQVRPLRRGLRQDMGETAANILVSGVSQGHDTLASLGPLLGLWRVTQGEMSREDYIQRYGHRGPNEFELSQAPAAADPEWIAAQLELLEDVDVPTMLAKHETQRDLIWTDYERRFPRKAQKMRKKLAQAAAAAREREAIRSEFTRFFGLVRHFALRAGEFSGLASGVFFLSLSELTGLLSGESVDFAELIAARKAAYARFCELPPYPALIRGRFDPYTWAADPDRRTDIFVVGADDQKPAEILLETAVRGFPGSVGIVEGRVRRLHSPREGATLQPGEILVTVTTNVGWTPLFPRAGAVVTDVGAPLSHAAIVARELGIPAVVGCGNATMRLQTGDLVRVDGGQGLVQIIMDNQQVESRV